MDRGQAKRVEENPNATPEKVIEADSIDAEQAEPKERVWVVRFLGRPGIRLITADEWAGAGVKDHADTYWNMYNDYTVKKDDLGLNDEQFSRIILMDNGFRVEQAEDLAV